MTGHFLEAVFRPRHIVIVGFSKNPEKSGFKFLTSLRHGGFKGKISLLGRERGEFEGLALYNSPDELPSGIDLALSVLSPSQTLETLPAVAKEGTRAAIVFTSGFAEMGADSAVMQQQLVRACSEHGMRLVGPNCMGMFNLPFGLNLTEIVDLPRGDIALVSQSGNVGITLWDQAGAMDVGFSTFVGFGNQADIPIHEYVEYLGDDDNTKVIALYLEGLKESSGDEFLAACARVSRKKPIVALKGGRTSAGRRAAESHTASLSSLERVYSAAFQEAGIVEVSHLEHLLPVADGLVRCPPMSGDKVAVVGSGGGHSTILTDEIELAGLQVPQFSEVLQAELRSRLPAWAPVSNPVDMTGAYTGDPSLFATLTDLVLTMDGDFDATINYGLYGPWMHGEIAKDSPYDYCSAAPLLGDVQRKYSKPVIFYTPFANREFDAFTAMRKAGVPCCYDISTAVAILAALRQRSGFLTRPPEAAIARSAIRENVMLDCLDNEVGAARFLADYGVDFAPSRPAANVDQVADEAEKIGFPVVIKAVLPGIAHKSDIGAVRTGISDSRAARDAAEAVQQSVVSALGAGAQAGFAVSKDLGRCREMIIGVTQDAAFGNIGLIGLGGILAEALDDVAVCLLPATDAKVERAIERLRSKVTFGAFRGEPRVDSSSVTNILNSLDQAMRSGKGIDSIECNPALLVGAYPVPVDAAISFKTSTPH